MTSYLTLLLATLGIMIGLFTVTGFINRMGGMLLDLGAWNIMAMIGMAYMFGWLVGAGLPPTATYIIGAVVIVRAAARARHQSLGRALLRLPAFGLGRAVAADLAHRRGLGAHRRGLVHADHVGGAENLLADHADDVRDLHALQHGGHHRLAADRRYDPGADRHVRRRVRDVRAVFREPRGDIALRVLLAALAFLTMFHPNDTFVWFPGVVVLVALVIGIWRHRSIAAPPGPAGGRTQGAMLRRWTTA